MDFIDAVRGPRAPLFLRTAPKEMGHNYVGMSICCWDS